MNPAQGLAVRAPRRLKPDQADGPIGRLNS